MIIAIVGSGNVGSALAQGLVRAGHVVQFGVRDAGSAKSRKAQASVSVPFLAVRDACRNAEAIILTTPPEAVKDIVAEWGDVRNKVIIDATNSVRTRPEPYPTAFHALKALTGSEAVVKCFNTTGFENMLDPVYPGFGGIDMFCAGNDKSAKAVAMKLSLDIGFGACWDFGGDDKVELLEKFALSWINMAIMQGHGRNLAFKVIRRP
ncbi:MAG: NAD(P)-binding domain-containing protein [Cyclobacteriaceae bacterium]|nr:NAD(P)-binding domain-containing protein [Cyclobacteriaceae bacterium]